MKGLRICTAMTLMALAALSNAAHINHDQKGQIALLPYYTVNNNFITNFTVTNRSSMFKAVRVRLLDSRISADLLNINLYLAPFDTWNATLRKDPASGLPNLITEDESCTYPDKQQLQAGITFENPYTATTDEDLTEGYIEIIEMGDIADGPGPAADNDKTAEIDGSGSADGVLTDASGDRSIPANIIPQANDLPLDCSVIADAWSAGAASSTTINGFEPGALSTEGIAEDTGDATEPYDNSQNAGLVAPSGGLKAYGILIDVGNGAAYVQEAEHIDRYTTVPQHYLPNDPAFYRLPSLASGNVREVYITDATGNGRKGDTMPLTEYDTGALQDISPLPSVPMGSNPLPIAALLSAEEVSIPHFVEDNLNGKTEIVLTFPMRKHAIHNSGKLTNQVNPDQTACAGSVNDGIDDGQSVWLENLDVVVQDFPHYANGSYCENAGFEEIVSYENTMLDTRCEVYFYGYEGNSGVVIFFNVDSPTPIMYPSPSHLFLQMAVNVNQVYPSSSASGTLFGTPNENAYELNLDEGFESGSMTFDFTGYRYEDHDGIQALTEPVGGLGTTVNNSWRGVPVIGFSAISSELESNTLGETIDLVREVYRE